MTSVYIFHCCLLKVSLHNRHIDLLTVTSVSGTCNLCYSENRGYRSNLQVIGVTNNRNCSVMIKCPSEPWQCPHSGLNDTTMTRSLKLKQLHGIQTSLLWHVKVSSVKIYVIHSGQRLLLPTWITASSLGEWAPWSRWEVIAKVAQL